MFTIQAIQAILLLEQLTDEQSKASSSKKVKGKGKERATTTDALPSSLNLFHTSQPKPKSKSTKSEHESESESDQESGSGSESESESDASTSNKIPAPPRQKITITALDDKELPTSLHANLPSLVTNLPSSSGQPLLNALKESNIHSLWGVQCAVGGALLERRDVICVAPTGSGKTLAYVLPTLVRLGDPTRSLSASSTVGEKSVGVESTSTGTGEKNRKRKASKKEEEVEQEPEKDEREGQGIRALIVVPTHDLAVQIEGVVKAVTRKRGWRVMVLSKATEKAVCDSSPGSGEAAAENKDRSDAEDGDDEEEKEDKNEGGSKGSLGIDILISTPERLHHLLESGKLSLSS
jgi:ATP-dependent RNA helicase DDX52/ROK1